MPRPRKKTSGADILAKVVAELCDPAASQPACRAAANDMPMPSIEALGEGMNLLRAVFFPGYFGPSDVGPETLPYYTGSALDKLLRLFSDQILRGYCFVCAMQGKAVCADCERKSRDLALEFLARLPAVRAMLLDDVCAAFDGDPAAKTPGETIFCYPSIRALTNYRVAHELWDLGVDVIPRILCEMAHSDTGIDIHPGARIGRRFFIDHGTGTVIGETCVIGERVRLYQGVTLGAKSFPKDDADRLVKGLARHPIVEDDVVIYSGATILGRITIGRGAVIGGNVWVTEDVPPGVRIVQARASVQVYQEGEGI